MVACKKAFDPLKEAGKGVRLLEGYLRVRTSARRWARPRSGAAGSHAAERATLRELYMIPERLGQRLGPALMEAMRQTPQ
jgi:hypothetical protein